MLKIKKFSLCLCYLTGIGSLASAHSQAYLSLPPTSLDWVHLATSLAYPAQSSRPITTRNYCRSPFLPTYLQSLSLGSHTLQHPRPPHLFSGSLFQLFSCLSQNNLPVCFISPRNLICRQRHRHRWPLIHRCQISSCYALYP